MTKFMTLGVNHKTAPLSVREKLAFDRDNAVCCAQKLLGTRLLSSVAIMSTCNRTEFYCENLSRDNLPNFWDWVRIEKQLSPQLNVEAHAYQYDNESAVAHILRVATGLDSLVLGESQVLGQVKAAYQNAQAGGTLGKGLARLFQFTLGAAKRIRTKTALGMNPLSVAQVAWQLAKPLFPQACRLRVLLIGSGEMISLSARHFRQWKGAQMMFVNRTKAKAFQLAQQFQGNAYDLSDLAACLQEADVVLTATTSPTPLLSRGLVASALKVRKPPHSFPLLFLDLAVPRDVEPEVNDLPGVCLYTVDDLQSKALNNQQARAQAVEVAEALVDAEARKFMMWLQMQTASGKVRRFREQCLSIREATVQEALLQLQSGKSPEVVVQRLGHLLTNRLMHHPTLALRNHALSKDLLL